ncbi:amino acid/polyamine/organocation transporter (APC superfamily) [Leucobacter luti]|uniref:Amino acid/polyamine/organocation transporter (APC superfamily) n=1 Tax=Leucobacter luti TaxID=340320 RepID=A0A4R6RUK7_9MICO|nr:APC family permease [Leucobacter luti]TDP89746.1 amino acid/polyamine/organocation transporter (APC superfamily) [Leucobacter luti]
MSSQQQAVEPPLDTTTVNRLQGNMGVGTLAMSVLAFSSPLATVAGTMPVLLMFGGDSAPAIYLIMTAMLLIFSVGFVLMSSRIKNPGGFYSFVTAGLGKAAGLGGAFLALVGYLFIGYFAPVFFAVTMSSFVVNTLGGPDIPWYWYALVIIVLTTYFAYNRIDLSAKVLTIVMVLEVLIIVVYDVAAFTHNVSTGAELSVSMPRPSDATFGLALLFAIGNFFGFEATVIYRDEVRNPARTIPRATYLSVLGIGVFYAATASAYVAFFGADGVQSAAAADTSNLFHNSIVLLLGRIFADVMTVLLITSTLACMLSIQNIAARYGFSLARDRALPRALGRVHPKHNSPYLSALAVGAVWAVGTVLFAVLALPPEQLYVVASGSGTFSVLLLMFIASAAVFVYFLRQRRNAPESVWRSLVAPLISSLFLGAVTIIAITNFPELVGGSGAITVIFMGLTFALFLGGFIYAWVLRSKKPDVYARLGRQKY